MTRLESDIEERPAVWEGFTATDDAGQTWRWEGGRWRVRVYARMRKPVTFIRRRRPVAPRYDPDE
jgi:hypothetical protein